MADEIIPGFLWIGPIDVAEDRNALQALEITHIVDAAGDRKPAFPDSFHYIHCANLADVKRANLFEYLEPVCAFINEAASSGGRAFVHCGAGISRSGAMVLGYLMYPKPTALAHTARDIRSLKDAIAEYRSRRPGLPHLPNTGFLAQLSSYEQQLHGTQSMLDELEQDAVRFISRICFDVSEADILRVLQRVGGPQNVDLAVREVRMLDNVSGTIAAVFESS